MYEWPARRRPVLIHIPDPLAPSPELAATFAGDYRVLSVQPRGDAPYQVHVFDVFALLDQFGFTGVTLVGEGLGCVTARALAAWFPERVVDLKLVRPTSTAEGDSLFERSLRDTF